MGFTEHMLQDNISLDASQTIRNVHKIDSHVSDMYLVTDASLLRKSCITMSHTSPTANKFLFISDHHHCMVACISVNIAYNKYH